MRGSREGAGAGRAAAGDARRLTGLLKRMGWVAFRRPLDPCAPFQVLSGDAAGLLGVDAEALVSGALRYADLLHPRDHARLLDEMERAAAGKSGYRLVYPIRCRDRKRWLREEGRFLCDDGGSAVAVEGMLVEAVEATRETSARIEERFHALEINPREVIAEFSSEGRFLYVSAGSENLLGYRAEEVMGRNVIEFIHPEDRNPTRDFFARVLRQRGPAHSVHRIRHRDGSWGWFESSGRAYRSATGELRFISIGRDISDRRAMEEQLARQLSVEQSVAELSREFLALGNHEIEDGIRGRLCVAASMAGAERTYLFVTGGRGRSITAVYEWSAPGFEAPAIHDDPELTHHFRSVGRQLMRGEVFNVPVVGELPDQMAAEREDLKQRGVRSILAIPVSSEHQVIGYQTFEALTEEHLWTEPEITRLRLVGEIFASALERKRREDALRESEERFRAMAEHANELIAEMDEEGRLLYLSPSCVDLLGYPAKQLTGRNFKELVHPDDFRSSATSLREALETTGEAHAVHRLRHHGGSWRWFDSSGRAFLTATGELRFVSIGRDITERKAMEEALESQLSAEQCIADLSRRFLDLGAEEIDGGIHYGLESVLEVAGADRAYLVEMGHRSPSGPEVFEACAQGVEPFAAQADLRNQRRFRWSVDLALKDEILHVPDTSRIPPEGEEERIEFQRRGVRSALGIPVRCGENLVGYLSFECLSGSKHWSDREISQLRVVGEIFASALNRKRTEHALARQLEFEQRIAELSRHFLAVGADQIEKAIRAALAEAAQLAEVQRCYLRSFEGGDREPRQICEWSEPGLPEASPRPLPWIGPRILAGKILHLPRLSMLPTEAWVERAELESRGVLSLLAIPVFSGETPTGFLGFESTDQQRWWSDQEITLLRLVGELFASALRRERAEDALRESQTQLLHSQKIEAVGRLAGGIAHDFNNLLTVILGFSNALLNELEEGHWAREDVTEINESAERAAALTRQLLTFSRRQVLQSEVVDLNERVAGLEEMLRRLLGEDVELELDLHPEVAAVEGDPYQFEQVLINLVVNARDAMPEGGHLWVKTRNLEVGPTEQNRLGLRSAGDHLVLSVGDSGCGMDEETRVHIFEPFFTTKEPGKGTGLGLSIVYSIVEQSGGAITVLAEPNKGTTFEITLPTVRAAVQTDQGSEQDGAASGDETLLLVEDEAAVRRLARRILEKRGYRVLEARDGAEALEVAAAHRGPVHLLLTDVVMPKLGGGELARKLTEARPGLRVLFMSGYPQERGRDVPSLPEGDFLQKPFTASALLAVVRNCLEKQRDP
jgi:PAS domain S-box-containing protein